MKGFLLPIVIFGFCLCSSTHVNAEDSNATARRYYITLSNTERTLIGRGSGASIVIGESFAAKAGLSKNDVANIGKYRFPSLQEAMNFMSGYGWKLAEAYSTTLAGSANTVWVIYKDVTDDSQLAEGLFEEKE
ncbi:MAG: hypothetical protein K1V75_01335 [Muribaculaceae bacterium]